MQMVFNLSWTILDSSLVCHVVKMKVVCVRVRVHISGFSELWKYLKASVSLRVSKCKLSGFFFCFFALCLLLLVCSGMRATDAETWGK